MKGRESDGSYDETQSCPACGYLLEVHTRNDLIDCIKYCWDHLAEAYK